MLQAEGNCVDVVFSMPCGDVSSYRLEAVVVELGVKVHH